MIRANHSHAVSVAPWREGLALARGGSAAESHQASASPEPSAFADRLQHGRDQDGVVRRRERAWPVTWQT